MLTWLSSRVQFVRGMCSLFVCEDGVIGTSGADQMYHLDCCTPSMLKSQAAGILEPSTHSRAMKNTTQITSCSRTRHSFGTGCLTL